MKVTPFHLLVAMLAGWLNSEQQKVIDYLNQENRVLRKRLGGRCIRFSEGLTRDARDDARAVNRHTCAPAQRPCLDQEISRDLER